ncbi:hypothetical protein MHEL_30040 [Mycolicibacterium helvum]|uniref:Aminoglycoside phosphotransferase n=1 Tax=Mycolicibacterium helvum TaxID=1534349 RepID=A0A7I7T8C5_9MYCO|nr:hypothetical protein MHEL_30040 [Mycolicibacterium helvum]
MPSGIDAVDSAWLTDALRSDPTIPDDATVTAVMAEQIAQDSGFSSLLYRLHLTGSPGLPATVIAKLAAQSQARGAMELLGGYRRELAFYRDIAGRAPMDAPHVYAARMADDSADFVLVLEDLREWDNADHLAGLSLERARLCIGQLAGLHAWSVQASTTAALQVFPRFDMPAVRDLLVPAFEPGWDIYRTHSAVPVPEPVARFAARFTEHAATALAGLTRAVHAATWRHYRLAAGFLMLLPVIILIGWGALPQRSRDLCLTLTDRAVATIADINAVEVF